MLIIFLFSENPTKHIRFTLNIGQSVLSQVYIRSKLISERVR